MWAGIRASAVIYGIGAFLGTNGLGQIIHRLVAECVTPLPDGECQNRIQTDVMFEGTSAGEFASGVLVLSVIMCVIAIILAWGEG